MTHKADIGSKRLISLDPQSWSRWVTQNPQVVFQEMLNTEFQWIAREGDVLIRAWDPILGEFLIANEIQLRYSSEMPRRMRLYAALAEEKFKLPVYPVLVVILPNSDGIPNQYLSTLGDLHARQDYKVIQLSEVDVETVFQQPVPSLLPFVPVLKGGEQELMIREALRRLQADPLLSELEPLLAFFARFVLDSQLVMDIMRWDMTVLRESPWYEEIKQEGIQLGKQAVVPILAELGLSADEIAQRLDLSPERVKQILGQQP